MSIESTFAISDKRFSIIIKFVAFNDHVNSIFKFYSCMNYLLYNFDYRLESDITDYYK